MEDEDIVIIKDEDELRERKRLLYEPNEDIDKMIEEKEMEELAYNNPQQYFEVKKENYFIKHKPDFQYLFNLSNSDLKWKKRRIKSITIAKMPSIKYGINTDIS